MERRDAIPALGAALPEAFLTQAWTAAEDPAGGCVFDGQAPKCFGVLVDLLGDRQPEVIVVHPYTKLVYALEGGRWGRIGSMQGVGCGSPPAPETHTVRLLPPQARSDVELDGVRHAFVPQRPCPAKGEVKDVELPRD